MSLVKFNLTLLSFLFSTTVLGEIDSLGCLKSEFTATVSHKGFPFGLTQNILKLTKKNCELTLAHEKLKFVKICQINANYLLINNIELNPNLVDYKL